jgi:hypothetical protein
MRCPHCAIHFHDNWEENDFARGRTSLSFQENSTIYVWLYRTASCPKCSGVTIQITTRNIERIQGYSLEKIESEQGYPLEERRQVYPIGANRGPVPSDVPPEIS